MKLINSLRFKIAGAFVGVISAMLILINTYPLMVAQNLIIRSKQNDLMEKANLITMALSSVPSLSTQNIASVMELIDVESGNGNERVLVVDETASVLFDSSIAKSFQSKYLVIPELSSALSGFDVFRCRYTGDAFNSRASVPIMQAEEVIGAVYIFENDIEQAVFLKNTQSDIKRFSFAIAAISLIAVTLISSILNKRIKALLVGIRHVRDGEYDKKVELSGSDELAEVAKEFNELSVRIQKTEEMRREFVSNASHELKTPLACIKLLADSIVQAERISQSEIREFLGDISEETDRLTRITEKLLALTRPDSDIVQRFLPVDLKDIILRVTDMLLPLSEYYRTKLYTNLEDGLCIMADSDGAYQIIYNLVENAIKYNVPGGMVQIELQRMQKKVVITIRDTGIGMSDEAAKLAFERFYRADKARSRETGGAGLGLSIVKRWVDVFGGSITLDTLPEKGSTFRLYFDTIKDGLSDMEDI